jgi:hypothetical protein
MEPVTEDWYWEEPEPVLAPMDMTQVQVTMTDNPIVAELLGPNGDVLRQWRERPPVGFRQR